MIKEIKQHRLDLLFSKLFINNENISFLSTGSLLYSDNVNKYAIWISETLPPNFIIYISESLTKLFSVFPIDYLTQKISETYNTNNLKVIIKDY